MKIKCPICGRKLEIPVQKAGKGVTELGYFPFCSERCKLIDLGDWLEGHYRIVKPNSGSEKRDVQDY